MIKFIRHDVKNLPNRTNPFDEAIKEVLKEPGTCYILTPYFNIYIIMEFCETNNETILITDIGELKTNISTVSELNLLISLIECKNLKVYDVSNLHAKILLKGNKLLIGSANFTKSGVGKNHEGSILVIDSNLILEVNEWIISLIHSFKLVSRDYLIYSFSKLPFVQTKLDESESVLKELNRIPILVKSTNLGNKIKISKTNNFNTKENNDSIMDIIKIFSTLEDAIKGVMYFKDAYDLFASECNNEEILSITFTRNKKLTMNIGQWEVLSIKRNIKIYNIVLGINKFLFNNFNNITVIKDIPFSDKWAKEEHGHIYLKFEWDLKNKFPEKLIEAWKNTILYAVNIFHHWSSSSYKRFHRVGITNLLSLKNNEIVNVIDEVFKHTND